MPISLRQRQRQVQLLEVLALGAADAAEIAAHAQLPREMVLREMRQLRRQGMIREVDGVYGLTDRGLDVLRARQP